MRICQHLYNVSTAWWFSGEESVTVLPTSDKAIHLDQEIQLRFKSSRDDLKSPPVPQLEICQTPASSASLSIRKAFWFVWGSHHLSHLGKSYRFPSPIPQLHSKHDYKHLQILADCKSVSLLVQSMLQTQGLHSAAHLCTNLGKFNLLILNFHHPSIVKPHSTPFFLAYQNKGNTGWE